MCLSPATRRDRYSPRFPIAGVERIAVERHRVSQDCVFGGGSRLDVATLSRGHRRQVPPLIREVTCVQGLE